MSNAALEASLLSAKYSMAKDKEAWLALYADDAIICDPVGVSPLDPTGLGHRGKAAIEKFYDDTIAANDIVFHIERSYPAGDSVANVVSLDTKMGDKTMVVEFIAVYQVDDDGKIIAMKAYWDFQQVLDQLAG